MDQLSHFKTLQNIYALAPINKIYNPILDIKEGETRIEIELSDKYHHAGGAVHGSVYFKMLDDAAFLAVSSLEYDVYVLTISFTTYLTRPVSSGILLATGKVVYQNKSQFIAESIVYDSNGNEVGRGNGIFIRSKVPLNKIKGYA